MADKLFKKIINGINSLKGTDVSLLAISVGAICMLLGLNIGEKQRKVFSAASIFVFIITVIPAVSKIAGEMLDNDKDEYYLDDDCFEVEW